jgi:hypothetical protein
MSSGFMVAMGLLGGALAGGEPPRKQEPPLACRRDALTPAERELHAERLAALRKATREVKELPQGYAFRLDASRETLANAAAWIALERLCCPFFDFALELPAGAEATWLRVTGPAGAKAILGAALETAR